MDYENNFAYRNRRLFRHNPPLWGVRTIHQLYPHFPWGTLAVNIIGAFLAGFALIWCRAKFPDYEEYFPIFFVGFLGAFTTFSAFALDSARYFLDAQYTKCVLNILLQLFTGLLAAGIGIILARFLVGNAGKIS